MQWNCDVRPDPAMARLPGSAAAPWRRSARATEALARSGARRSIALGARRDRHEEQWLWPGAHALAARRGLCVATGAVGATSTRRARRGLTEALGVRSSARLHHKRSALARAATASPLATPPWRHEAAAGSFSLPSGGQESLWRRLQGG